MIVEPVVLTGRLTYEDLLEIHRFRVRATVRPGILVLMGVVSGALLTLLVGMSTRVKLGWHLYLIMGFFVYWPWGWLLTREYAGRGRLRRAAATTEENTVTLTADLISVASGDELARVAWKRLKEVVELRDGMAFVLQRGAVWFYLPWRVMHDDDRADILATAEEKGVRIRRSRTDEAR